MCAASIDQVTGLPLVGGPSYIDQIPLGAQVFPWDDVGTTQYPARGPAYPDDILPTTALVSGQNVNNVQKVQSVYTDGNHNLRVAIAAGGGGGGGAPAWPSMTDSANFRNNVSSGFWTITPTGLSSTRIYMLSWGFVIDTTGAAWTNPNGRMTLQIDYGGPGFFHVDHVFVAGPVASPNPKVGGGKLLFPSGLPLTDSSGRNFVKFNLSTDDNELAFFSLAYVMG